MVEGCERPAICLPKSVDARSASTAHSMESELTIATEYRQRLKMENRRIFLVFSTGTISCVLTGLLRSGGVKCARQGLIGGSIE